MLSNRRLALFVLAFGFAAAALVRGTQETYAVFLLPISAEFGWQRAEVSSVYSVAFLTLGLSGPLVGSLFDRFGPLGVYLPGAACAGAGCLLASQAQTLWQFYIVLGLLFGFAVASCGYVPMAALLSRWFRRRLNTALAFGHSSHGIGILLLAPTAQRLIDAWGWRHAYLGLAGIVLLLLPPALLLPWRRVTAGHPDYRMASPPPRHASAPVRDGAVPGATAALRMPAFWGIAATFFFTSVGMYAINLQTPAYLVEIGYTPQQAARAYGLIGLLLPAGMIGFGWLGDRLGRRRAVLISYAGTLTGMVALMLLRHGPSLPALALFVVAFGSTLGSRGPAISTIASIIFGGPSFGRIYGLITVGMGLGAAAGAWLGGWLVDLTGGYLAGQLTAITAILLGAAPFVTVPVIART